MAEDRTEGKRKDRVTVKTLKLIDALRAAANAMIAAEPELTELDSELGDGDCGMGLKTGFTAVLAALEGKDDASANAQSDTATPVPTAFMSLRRQSRHT